jgi:hypothetical protein
MALGWDIAAQAQLAGGTVKPAILFRMATDPVVRLWGGAGDLAMGEDLIEDTEGAIYTGMGELLSLPQVNALVNGLAERVEFQLSGAAISGEIAAIAGTEAADIRGAVVHLGFMVFGADMQQLSPTAWLWDGVADSLKVSRQGDDQGGVSRAIGLSVGSLLTGRQRANLGYFSDADQRRRSSDDAYCSLVKTYSAGSTKNWPI